MNKRTKLNNDKVFLLTPGAVLLALAIALIGDNIVKGTYVPEMIIVALAIISIISAVINFASHHSTERKIIVGISVAISLYLGLVSVYRLMLSGIGFMG